MVKNLERVEILTIEDLPFLKGFMEDILVKEFLPFTLVFDTKTGLLLQKLEKTVVNKVQESYKDGNFLATIHYSKARGKLNDFLDFFKPRAKNVSGKEVLGIGMGWGQDLNAVKELGAHVTGCDPNPCSSQIGEECGFDVVNDYFDPSLFDEKFDIVLCNEVLEHVDDPIDFLSNVKEVIKPEGLIFIKVPDCITQLRAGDPGMLSHKHTIYYTPNSLRKNLNVSGFGKCKIISAHHDNGLFAVGQVSDTILDLKKIDELPLVKKYGKLFQDFYESMQSRINRSKNHIGLIGCTRTTIYLLHKLNWGDSEVTVFETDDGKVGKMIFVDKHLVQHQEKLFTEINPDEAWITPIGYIT
ncbi:MAG: class I SAM-dependent methyltransferase, partial [Candidatus Hodarchaeota archaeon]